MRVLAAGKGIKLQIQAAPEEQKGQPNKRGTKKNAKVEQILTAKDLTLDVYEELSLKKKTGKTTTEEQVQNFILDQNPFNNFLSLVDSEKYQAEDNLKSDKHFRKVKVAKNLLMLLGWEYARDENQLKKELVRDSFVEKVVKDRSSRSNGD